MSYRTCWLTKADLSRIENIEDLPTGTLREDEDSYGAVGGAYASNALNKIRDPQLRKRAEFGIQRFFEK